MTDTAMTEPATTELVTRSDVAMWADPSRVVARLFVPGQELLADRESRASGVLARILGMSDEDVSAAYRYVQDRYAGRHRDLAGLTHRHYQQVAHRMPAAATLTEDQRGLVGATFTHEFAIEGAALFNPSAVAHPDQSGLPPGHCRFLLSLRAVGEGHLSCIEFRTGVLGPGGQLSLDDPGPHAELGAMGPCPINRDVFAVKLTDWGADSESASYLIGELPPTFVESDLDRALGALARQGITRHGASRTDELARRIARCFYQIDFAPESTVAERVLWPHAPSETQGMEDARFVRVLDEEGPVYRATYTAFDGRRIEPQLIETADFQRFQISQLAGPAAKDKGLALFPRKIGGRHVALSRSDRENSGITTSSNGRYWDEPAMLHGPSRTWEIIQTGNCGSPVETEAGWVVLMHGVGPMREYSISALLLDLDDPTKVIGGLRQPLIAPAEDERNGYVPNVVYSCGALLHGDQLLIPYGASDASVRFAFVDVPLLIARLTEDGPPSLMREKRPE